jgi:hypothetical protein
MNQTVVDITEVIAELAEIRAEKAKWAKRESEIRNLVLESTGNIATQIYSDSGVIAEVVLSERRSINDWDNFQMAFPEAYEALVKTSEVLTLTLKK